MHLPYLAELSDRFRIEALADLSPSALHACGERYGVSRTVTDWRELLDAPLDAVLVATPGSHEPMAVAAADAGLHVFVEKPMALTPPEAEAMIRAAERADRRLMVGTMKRYDPAYERLLELLPGVGELRLVHVTTLESPFRAYLEHHRVFEADDIDPSTVSAADAEARRRIDARLGDLDETVRWCYRNILLDNLVHEVNAVSGALGEPTEVTSAELDRDCVRFSLRYGDVPCHLSWVDLPGMARYSQELRFLGTERRLTLRWPSPLLRNAPTQLTIESGVAGSAESSECRVTVGYDEAFRRELVEFSEAVRTGRDPRTSGGDGLRDIRTLEAVARAGGVRQPVSIEA